ncbi:hypothetical protein [Psychrobacter sanguinis]|uniref:hypothetical protein n=1 Tax=Psychrobacter sanguinis TaxID=861445 RepID=UPI0019192630|nr:hypothetical protein [Psychrobacter sanguinis]MCC3309171.1 hypothetical protein [Psychrobacter sanguinis]UEC26448.1 hypothetical protein LK453_04815 [Psychrobacter sanguinis]
MKVVCPYCHASSVCKLSDAAAEQAVDQQLSSAVLKGAARELCQSLEVHPLIKVVMGMTLIVTFQYLKSNYGSLPLVQQPYRCENCNQVFTVFYPFV